MKHINEGKLWVNGQSCTGEIDPLAFDSTRTTLQEDRVISSHQPAPPLKLAASSYLNTAPLIWSFLHGSRKHSVELIEGVPARCAQMLSEATVDAALVPVIEYQRIDDISLVPGVCVGSKREVRSVVLVSKGPELDKIRSVALDESSRTSAALVKIVFREFLGSEPRWTISAPNPALMLGDNDAALIIGDPAMTFPRDDLTVWDMAALWRKYTDLGFVFAMWMVRDEATKAARALDFASARDEGFALRGDIIDYYSSTLGLSRASLKEYLEENISFDLDDQMRAGLDLYFLLAQKHGLLSKVKPLKTLAP